MPRHRAAALPVEKAVAQAKKTLVHDHIELDELQTKIDQANSEIERLKSELQQTKAPQSQSGNAPPQP